MADLIGADPREIIFTSGATESNNIAVKGVPRFYKSKKKHVITTQTVSFKPPKVQYANTEGKERCLESDVAYI